MSEEFFERLRERAEQKALFSERILEEPRRRYLRGVDNTIEALKERMVGEIAPMRLDLRVSWGKPGYTFLVDQNDEIHARWDGMHGTDGEEVVVMVFRDAS